MKIYVWGTGGKLGNITNDSKLSIDDIVGFIDNDVTKKEVGGITVYQPEEMLDKYYDLIIVASTYTMDIYNQCKELGLDLNKIYFPYKHFILKDINNNYDLPEKLLGKEFVNNTKEMYYITDDTNIHKRLFLNDTKFKNEFFYNSDHIRISSFQLIVNEINKRNVSGEVAEVGVFRGDFAQYINFAFPNKKCYLFDTFEGFDEQELQSQNVNDSTSEVLTQVFNNTSLEIVMNKITYPENVVIKKGYFPDSLKGLEEQFAFVSLDVDLEKSMYECLKYFYPRLSTGGYIFMHDYNNAIWDEGLKRTIERYEKENGIILPKVPLADNCGTLVITK